MNSLVSVIIPAYNAQHCLAACIESALAQRVAVQVIVVNDGSTDQTRAVARRYRDRILYLEQSNQGQGSARNVGLERSHADYIAFLDADDYWLPGFLESCVAFLDAQPGVIAVSSGLLLRDVSGGERILPGAIRGTSGMKNPVVLDDFFRFWADQDHVRTGSVLLRKSIIDKAGMQRADLRISQDLEYWGYLATFGKWGFIPVPLWVGNSRIAAASGWSRKYRKRRELCPTVESWEERILPRLKPNHQASFQVVRGRVAANFAHSKILGGAPAEARLIVERYGDDMPVNRLTALMRVGARYGASAWWLACVVIRSKELGKALRLAVSASLWARPREPNGPKF